MKNGRNTAGQFATGNTGRPKGSRNWATLAIECLLQGQAEAWTQTAVTKELEGDSVFKLSVERIALPQRIISLANKMRNALDGSEAAGIVLTAVSDREPTPIGATRIMGL